MELGKIDLKNPQPLYSQISGMIEEKITNNEINVGDKIPSIEELSKSFEVGHNTIRVALSELVKKGYIISRKNLGTVVVSSKPNVFDLGDGRNEIAVMHITQDVNSETNFTRTFTILSGIGERGREKEMCVIINLINKSPDIPLLINKHKKQLAGVIGTGTITKAEYRLLKSSGIPFVLIGDLNDSELIEPEADIIVNDDFNAVYIAAKHLLDLGHRRICYLARFLGRYSWEKEKTRGYEQALKDKGITVDRKLEIEFGGYDSGKVKAVIEKMIDESADFTALICDDQELCVGAKNALNEKGLGVPEDISIVVTAPYEKSTRVTYDPADLGRAAVDRLLERLTNPDWKPGRIVVPYELVEDGTTKAVGKASEQKLVI